MNRRDLIARGYFPKELPPPFKTNYLADFATSRTISFPNPQKKTAKLYSHNHVRYSSLRRNLGIPNPIFFLELSHLLDINWATISQITSHSSFSKSKPTYPLCQSGNVLYPLHLIST